MLQTDKDFVEIAFFTANYIDKFTKILSGLHMIVMLIVYTGKKSEEEYDNENQAQ